MKIVGRHVRSPTVHAACQCIQLRHIRPIPLQPRGPPERTSKLAEVPLSLKRNAVIAAPILVQRVPGRRGHSGGGNVNATRQLCLVDV